MYLGLRPPWGGHAAATPIDGGAVAAAPGDAGAGKPTKKRHGPRRRPVASGPSAPGTGAPGGPAMTGGDSDDQAWANQGDSVEETGPAPVVLSAADRALEWRGDDVTPPPRTVDMNSNARPLDDAEIKSVIAGQSGAAQSCVVQAASAVNAQMQATITVKLVVDGKGNVTRSKLQAPHYLFEHGLLACIKPALARLKFPATGMPTLVTMPINLT